MELQNSFGTTAFGGFKKEQVTAYIDEIVASYSSQISELQRKFNQAQKDLSEFKEIVEQQHETIIDTHDKIEGTASELNQRDEIIARLKLEVAEKDNKYTEALNNLSSCNQEISSLMQRIEQIGGAKAQASIIIADTEKEAEKTLSDARIYATHLIDDAKSQTAEMLDDAEIFAEKITSDARTSSTQMIDNAKGESATILADAQIDAQRTSSKLIEDAKAQASSIVFNAEVESEGVINEAKKAQTDLEVCRQQILELNREKREHDLAEAEDIVAKATAQADDILRQAKRQYEVEREKFESTLKGVEQQKQIILTSLEEIKSSVQDIRIVKSQNSTSSFPHKPQNPNNSGNSVQSQNSFRRKFNR